MCFVVVLFCGNNHSCLLTKSTVTIQDAFYTLSEVGWLAFVCSPPSSIDFRNRDKLPRWNRRFDQFRQASGLSAEDDSQQISKELYCMRDKVEDTLTSTDISRADWSRYSEVIATFNAFSKYGRKWFSNVCGLTGATKKKASSWSNSSPVSTVWQTTVLTVTWRMIWSKIDKALLEHLQLNLELA